ncbi:MAG TPA: hypothetical protein VK828_14345 [Terriglobales bacterium]|jgi:hypothetical protein|nr:hypothetical protein [Terriglobales bacterium]
MKSRFSNNLALVALGLVISISLSPAASARDQVLPAGTILQCTLNEPNFSAATAEIGDPVLCHLRGMTEFGEQVFPRGSYLVGHLESAKDPGHFFGKGYLKLQFDRIGLPSGDLPLDAKVIATRGYKVDREGKIDGKGHAKRDVAEWMLPPLWPWKVIMLPARGPRPKLKGETTLSLRLMDDVQIPQLSQVSGRESNFGGQLQRESFHNSVDDLPDNVVRRVRSTGAQMSNGGQTLGPEWHFFGRSKSESLRDSVNDVPCRIIHDTSPNDQVRAETQTASYATYSPQPTTITEVNVPQGVPLLVMNTGTLRALNNYTFEDGRITYTLAGGGGGVIMSDEVDWSATLRLNAQRGLRIVLRSGRTNSVAPM